MRCLGVKEIQRRNSIGHLKVPVDFSPLEFYPHSKIHFELESKEILDKCVVQFLRVYYEHEYKNDYMGQYTLHGFSNKFLGFRVLHHLLITYLSCKMMWKCNNPKNWWKPWNNRKDLSTLEVYISCSIYCLPFPLN